MCLYNQNKNEQQQQQYRVEWEKEREIISYTVQRETRKSVETSALDNSSKSMAIEQQPAIAAAATIITIKQWSNQIALNNLQCLKRHGAFHVTTANSVFSDLMK